MREYQRILIFSGGQLGPWALQEINEADLLLGVDRGTLFLLQQGHQPDVALGDFDSVTAQELAWIKAKCPNLTACDPIMKDETDTELAFNWALQQEPTEIVLLGVMGCRFDHTLANVHLLAKGLQAGIPCRIVDEKNQIILIDQTTIIHRDQFPQISLLPLTPQVTGITLTGFQYPLNQATLTTGNSIGISNILRDNTGTIELTSGQLLVIKSSD